MRTDKDDYYKTMMTSGMRPRIKLAHRYFFRKLKLASIKNDELATRLYLKLSNQAMYYILSPKLAKTIYERV